MCIRDSDAVPRKSLPGAARLRQQALPSAGEQPLQFDPALAPGWAGATGASRQALRRASPKGLRGSCP
eukprot:13019251-Alexandrium_andersonii.AAC.1